MVHSFQTIDNFRDPAETVQRRSIICPSMLFRSATLDYASEEDLAKLVEEFEVNTILDLRSELEAQLGQCGSPFNTFPVATALKLKASDMEVSEEDAEPDDIVEKSDGPTRKTIMINFAGKKFRKCAVWRAAPIRLKLQIVGLIASGQKPRAVKLVGEEIIRKKGLDGLYRDFIDYCDQEICQALQVLSDERNYPVLIHCTQGKDRTGLVTALALAAAGVSEEKIIEDYAKSRQGLARVRDHMVAEMQKDGLSPSFADAPPDAMRRAFDYMREKHGSIEGYLDHIGFCRADREAIKRVLTMNRFSHSDLIRRKNAKRRKNPRTSTSAPNSPLLSPAKEDRRASDVNSMGMLRPRPPPRRASYATPEGKLSGHRYKPLGAQGAQKSGNAIVDMLSEVKWNPCFKKMAALAEREGEEKEENEERAERGLSPKAERRAPPLPPRAKANFA